MPGRRPPQRRARRRRRNLEELEPTQLTTYQPSTAPVPDGEIIIERGSTARDLGPKLNRSAGDIVRFLLLQGEMVMATQSLTDDMIELFEIAPTSAGSPLGGPPARHAATTSWRRGTGRGSTTGSAGEAATATGGTASVATTGRTAGPGGTAGTTGGTTAGALGVGTAWT